MTPQPCLVRAQAIRLHYTYLPACGLWTIRPAGGPAERARYWTAASEALPAEPISLDRQPGQPLRAGRPDPTPDTPKVSRIRRLALTPAPQRGWVVGLTIRAEGPYYEGRQIDVDEWAEPYTYQEARHKLVEVLLDRNPWQALARIILADTDDLEHLGAPE